MSPNSDPQAVLDRLGRAVLLCASCHAPLSADDFFELGMRLPDHGETREEYIDDELIDYVSHPRCPLGKQAG